MTDDKQIKCEYLNNPCYKAARSSVFIAAIFSLIVFGLLIANFIQLNFVAPKMAEKLEAAKLQLRRQAEDPLILEEIRKLDYRIRTDKIKRQAFSRNGAFLLFGGMTVLLVSLKLCSVFSNKPLLPGPTTDMTPIQVKNARLARNSLLVLSLFFIVIVILFVLYPGVDFITTNPPAPPSVEQLKNNWHRFRGYAGSGITDFKNIPSAWTESNDKTIKWKTPIPLPGHNSPVVWNGHIFLSGADENKRQVYCFNADSGDLLWQSDVITSMAPPAELNIMEDTGYAASTLVTDGRFVCTVFANGDIACFDITGRQLWSKNLGTPDSMYGFATSLELYRNTIILQFDQGAAEDQLSSLIAFDWFSGQIVWQTKRPVPNSWTSPIVVDIDQKPQLITCADPWVIAYDPQNGSEIWRVDCLGGDLAPSPLYAGGFIFAIEPYSKLVAIKPGQGDVTETNIVWTADEGIPDICCPVSNDEFIFLLTTEGTLSCYKVIDGQKVWQEKLDSDFQASPSLVNGKLFVLSDQGTLYVIAASDKYELLGKSLLNEKTVASPAFTDGRMYIRGEKNLYCLENQSE